MPTVPGEGASPVESFHGVYDLAEYAAIFGEVRAATHDATTVLFSLVDRAAISGPGASFGGILFDCDHVRTPSLKTAMEAIGGITAAVREQCPSCTSIHLRLAPDIYYPPGFIQTLHATFAITGWSAIGEATHVITRDSYRPRKSTLRNARKAERRGTVTVVEPDVCFDFLSAVKREKGYRFNYSRATFLEQARHFPETFRHHGVLDERGDLLAAAFEAVSRDWGLLLNWDQSDQGRSVGATDLLLLARLEDLFWAGCRFVDLGTITEGRAANWGLIRHKENFGGHGVLRNHYVLILDAS